MTTAQVVQLHPCGRCGGPSKAVDLDFEGETVATLRTCDGCLEKGLQELARVRPVFDAMLAIGVDRDVANDVMTFLLDRFDPAL